MTLAPPLSTGEGPPPDEVETLLRAYFRSEMRDPWPAPPLIRSTVATPADRTSARGSNRSRFALAASVALLVGGSLLIPGRSPSRQTTASPLRMLPGQATRVRIQETLIQPKDKPTELRIDVIEEVPPGK
jgi:hypothetical protein